MHVISEWEIIRKFLNKNFFYEIGILIQKMFWYIFLVIYWYSLFFGIFLIFKNEFVYKVNYAWFYRNLCGMKTQ